MATCFNVSSPYKSWLPVRNQNSNSSNPIIFFPPFLMISFFIIFSTLPTGLFNRFDSSFFDCQAFCVACEEFVESFNVILFWRNRRFLACGKYFFGQPCVKSLSATVHEIACQNSHSPRTALASSFQCRNRGVQCSRHNGKSSFRGLEESAVTCKAVNFYVSLSKRMSMPVLSAPRAVKSCARIKFGIVKFACCVRTKSGLPSVRPVMLSPER